MDSLEKEFLELMLVELKKIPELLRQIHDPVEKLQAIAMFLPYVCPKADEDWEDEDDG